MSSISTSRAIIAISLVLLILAQCADARKKDRKHRRHRGEHLVRNVFVIKVESCGRRVRFGIKGHKAKVVMQNSSVGFIRGH